MRTWTHTRRQQDLITPIYNTS